MPAKSGAKGTLATTAERRVRVEEMLTQGLNAQLIHKAMRQEAAKATAAGDPRPARLLVSPKQVEHDVTWVYAKWKAEREAPGAAEGRREKVVKMTEQFYLECKASKNKAVEAKALALVQRVAGIHHDDTLARLAAAKLEAETARIRAGVGLDDPELLALQKAKLEAEVARLRAGGKVDPAEAMAGALVVVVPPFAPDEPVT